MRGRNKERRKGKKKRRYRKGRRRERKEKKKEEWGKERRKISCISWTGGWILYHWTIWKAPEWPQAWLQSLWVSLALNWHVTSILLTVIQFHMWTQPHIHGTGSCQGNQIWNTPEFVVPAPASREPGTPSRKMVPTPDSSGSLRGNHWEAQQLPEFLPLHPGSLKASLSWGMVRVAQGQDWGREEVKLFSGSEMSQDWGGGGFRRSLGSG